MSSAAAIAAYPDLGDEDGNPYVDGPTRLLREGYDRGMHDLAVRNAGWGDELVRMRLAADRDGLATILGRSYNDDIPGDEPSMFDYEVVDRIFGTGKVRDEREVKAEALEEAARKRWARYSGVPENLRRQATELRSGMEQGKLIP